jgi:NADPH:quinone reductase-like Zn-dependent oxidoreductase
MHLVGTMQCSRLIHTGVVESVGEGVLRWKIGDRVIANFNQQHIGGVSTLLKSY